jgi:hypothetical protein
VEIMGNVDKYTVYIPPEIKRLAHAEAVRRGLTLSEAIAQALEMWLVRGNDDARFVVGS